MADPKNKVAGDNTPATNTTPLEGNDQLKAVIAQLESTILEKNEVISQHENAIDEKDQVIAELKKEIDETTGQMIGQSIHITSLESTIAQAQKEGKLPLEVIHNNVKYTVLSGANVHGNVYTKTEIASNPKVIGEILAITGQGILKVVEEEA